MDSLHFILILALGTATSIQGKPYIGGSMGYGNHGSCGSDFSAEGHSESGECYEEYVDGHYDHFDEYAHEHDNHYVEVDSYDDSDVFHEKSSDSESTCKTICSSNTLADSDFAYADYGNDYMHGQNMMQDNYGGCQGGYGCHGMGMGGYGMGGYGMGGMGGYGRGRYGCGGMGGYPSCQNSDMYEEGMYQEGCTHGQYGVGRDFYQNNDFTCTEESTCCSDHEVFQESCSTGDSYVEGSSSGCSHGSESECSGYGAAVMDEEYCGDSHCAHESDYENHRGGFC